MDTHSDELHKLDHTLALLVATLEAWPDAQPADDPLSDLPAVDVLLQELDATKPPDSQQG